MPGVAVGAPRGSDRLTAGLGVQLEGGLGSSCRAQSLQDRDGVTVPAPYRWASSREFLIRVPLAVAGSRGKPRRGLLVAETPIRAVATPL